MTVSLIARQFQIFKIYLSQMVVIFLMNIIKIKE